MEEHPVIEREYTRVHEEKRQRPVRSGGSGQTMWVVRLGDVGGPAGRCGSGQTRMGTDPDNMSPPSPSTCPHHHACHTPSITSHVPSPHHCIHCTLTCCTPCALTVVPHVPSPVMPHVPPPSCPMCLHCRAPRALTVASVTPHCRVPSAPPWTHPQPHHSPP